MTMATKLQQAIRQDLADYKKKMSSFEKEQKAIEKKIDALNSEYAEVLELANYRKKAGAPRGRKVKRGQTRQLVVDALRNSPDPLKPRQIHNAIVDAGNKVTAAAVRQQLLKLVNSGEVVKDSSKRYGVGKASTPPKYIRRKKESK
jgi:hypothetical protein